MPVCVIVRRRRITGFVALPADFLFSHHFLFALKAVEGCSDFLFENVADR